MSSEKVTAFTKDNFEGEVLKYEGVAMVDFWAPWCGPCRAVGPIIDELADDYENKVKIGKVNVDEQSEIAAKYRVMSIPTIMVFKNGEMIEKIVGARPKEELSKLLDKNL